MMIVLDTNVLVSGMLQAHGPSGEIVRRVALGDLALAFDARILTEYEEVLKRPKFRLESHRVEAVMDQIRARGFAAAARPLDLGLDDPDDEVFVEVAVAAQATLLVTGNLKHFRPVRRPDLEILSPRDFITRWSGQEPT